MKYFSLRQKGLSYDTAEDLHLIIQWLTERSKYVEPLNVVYRHFEKASYQKMDDRIPSMLEQLDFDYASFTIDGYIQHIEQHLQRKVELVPFDLSPATSGVCVRKESQDLIFFNQNRHTILQQHIVLHESAHLLFDHELLKINLEEFEDTLNETFKLTIHFRTYDVILAAAIAHYLPVNNEQEAEAEEFARQFMSKVQVYKRHRELRMTRNIRLFPPFK